MLPFWFVLYIFNMVSEHVYSCFVFFWLFFSELKFFYSSRARFSDCFLCFVFGSCESVFSVWSVFSCSDHLSIYLIIVFCPDHHSIYFFLVIKLSQGSSILRVNVHLTVNVRSNILLLLTFNVMRLSISRLKMVQSECLSGCLAFECLSASMLESVTHRSNNKLLFYLLNVIFCGSL